MDILAHRGFWKKKYEKNSMDSFRLAIGKNFGLETDLRDFKGSIVISHDPIINEMNILLFEDLLNLYKKSKSEAILALNIKSDGIILEAESLLKRFKIKNYFFFDMSIPELINAYKKNIKKIFCRESEYESPEKVLNLTNGVWLDRFNGSHQNLASSILYFLKNKKKIAIVSPELHKKDLNLMYDCWKEIKYLEIPKESRKHLMLCTDYPLLARDFFKNDN